ncbi:uncharacterized protein [Notamacropus eugenii]|uniref:uncharacterized protein n=1 Tax=Notamacropus eugenii TaxID=9315 RepID=UPI003B66ED02
MQPPGIKNWQSASTQGPPPHSSPHPPIPGAGAGGALRTRRPGRGVRASSQPLRLTRWRCPGRPGAPPGGSKGQGAAVSRLTRAQGAGGGSTAPPRDLARVRAPGGAAWGSELRTRFLAPHLLPRLPGVLAGLPRCPPAVAAATVNRACLHVVYMKDPAGGVFEEGPRRRRRRSGGQGEGRQEGVPAATSTATAAVATAHPGSAPDRPDGIAPRTDGQTERSGQGWAPGNSRGCQAHFDHHVFLALKRTQRIGINIKDPRDGSE